MLSLDVEKKMIDTGHVDCYFDDRYKYCNVGLFLTMMKSNRLY